MEMVSNWFSSEGFMPHGHCFLWIPSILWTSVISDALIALAYLSIPVSLIYFIRKRRDMPFDWMFIAFGVFILACGATHVVDIWVVWKPDYVLSVTLKAITAAASVVTAVAMIRLVPIALRIPSPSQLAAVNAELQKANDDLRAAMERAEVANRAKSAFLASMSHELRTPLNAVLGYTQILKRDKSLSTAQQAGISTIQQGGQHLLALINDVLDLSRVDAGKMEFHPKPVRLGELLSVVADIMRVRAEQKHLHFELALIAGLPQAVSVDETRLRQVLLNLLGNALKFTDRGAVRLHVLPLPAEPGQGADVARVRFEVLDDGIGIAPAQHEAIFRPFEQVGDVSRRAGGTGLGLAISRQLVQLMGGKLQVESAPGKGSRFWFDVPLPVVEAPGATAGTEHIATGYVGPRKTILVVDDVATNRALLRDLLGSLGFRTLEAENGMSALMQTQAVRPDMVLLDMVMPGMDGIETLRRLRADARTADTPVLIISASSTPEEEERSLEVGAKAFLPKPVNEHDLLREIGAHLKLEWTE
ncbi:signal transduction histidine kinase/ActR/RegA family two-component response regulator [Duganella sp. SG902]|uniref:ATP-binding protein n=1 Tax=Duganella sp. SG902 TaxID=2587016 RepID=UPI00159EB080|nr:ATP-binding protein [Duganella sp. SG902]NVM77249.1 signal transduction histidine kinase/ActR/RegA family two-component response regulator [Duganella sp. SG902]